MRKLVSAALAASLLLSPVAEANNGRGGGWHGGFARGPGWRPGYRWGFYRGHWGWWAPALFGLAVGAAVAGPYYYQQPYPYYAPPRQCWSGYAWYPC